MSIEKFINRLKYGFYTIERIENIADQRIGLITHGLVCGLICNLLSIIGLKYMISLGAVPLCTIMVAALFLDLYIMYIIEKKNILTQLYTLLYQRFCIIRVCSVQQYNNSKSAFPTKCRFLFSI